ncbi:hypothetical protein CYG68_21145 [Morganella morganii]|uniref:Uncharacterized protein n=1 Tax=Morganella morganii TaxID=582 RepID=A0A8I0U866_MORMO|nr:hypothetical protein [Morganella morganii]MBE8614829.1 hypothetical protein [Morganella morganii]
MPIYEHEFDVMESELADLKSAGIPEEHCYHALMILELKRVKQSLRNLEETTDSQLSAIHLLG